MKNYFKRYLCLLIFSISLIIGILGSNSAKAEDISNKYINAVPVMTSNTSPSGVASGDNYYNATAPYKAFDGVVRYGSPGDYHAWGTNNTTGKLCYEFPQKKVISAYALDYNTNSLTERAKQWTFEGWDGAKWIVLDSRTVTDWKTTDRRIFEINNNIPYIKYQLNITSNNGCVSGTVNLSVDELELLEKLNNSSISLNVSSMNLAIGQSQQLTAITDPNGIGVAWTSSDESIAKYDIVTGKVIAVGEGVCTITATTTDGSNLSASCTVNVTNPIVPTITLNKTSDSLVIEQTDNLVATTTPAGVQVTWKSSDESVATVDSTGKVTALKEGQAVITATTADGLTATCAVTVTPKTAEPTNPDPDPTDSEDIVNIAHAKGDNTNNAGGDVTIIFHGAADTTLSVVKTADVKEVWVGDNFTYTIVVTNTGTKTAKAVIVNDPAPTHIDFVVNGITTTQGKIDPSSTSKNIIVNVGDIAPGATVTIKVPATVIL
ncbi:hypothetical protein LF65_02291 [Clostridium beijerinckii]|uniref:BIG2 domain-containing protein n=1 Tax=Clostridium beijerinckii TaxID=1520 RepID=A0A0B5QLK2_CLOBE|nr:Ig-like domain-containing protein [Clostridium beijerinckii]AJG98877.1 hypothetical protein LF65_02291 [Clostridium beijerinckii]